MDIHEVLAREDDPVEVLKRCIDSVNKQHDGRVKQHMLNMIVSRYIGSEIGSGYVLSSEDDRVVLKDRQGNIVS